ncbi:MAG TPA: TIGR03619 family F420-dependent LLM class oxidoreductase [Dehalococcoidia bacterium]|nr:TIGR03619 family F420-dependent LLM class oxidoreductase [Dehalococcoidia bacterium]
MRFAISLPNLGTYSDVDKIITIARDAEAAGWDALFIWDHMLGHPSWAPSLCDPTIALGALAVSTQRIRIGTMITPVPRRRPWKLAREMATLDRLSGGRVTLGVGLGFPPEEYSTFGEEPDARVRAEKLDEGLEVLTGLWSGEPYAFNGTHFRIEETAFLPQPVQRPRIPIWVGGEWPNRRAWRRAARYDGVFPIKGGGVESFTPGELRDIVDDTLAHRESDAPFDVVLSGEAAHDGAIWNGPNVRDYADAGCTWWLTVLSDFAGDFAEMRRRAQEGPPQL